MLEKKHQVAQVVAIRTRGQITGEFLPDHDEPVLAKAGIKPNAPKLEHNSYMLRLFLDRRPEQEQVQTSLISLQEQWHSESDLVAITKSVRLNLEYDFKRRPVRPTMRDVQGTSHLAFDSVPWETDEQAREAIQRFRGWRLGQKRILKTLSDFMAWEAYHTMAAPLRAAGVGLRGDGPLGHLYRQFLRALVRDEWGLSLIDPETDERSTYGEVVHWLVTVGFPDASVDDLKNARRNASKLAAQTIYLNNDVVLLLRAIMERYPGFDLERAMHPDHLTEARAALSL
jgi:hypothetical protein